jgi:hypothetical protein
VLLGEVDLGFLQVGIGEDAAGGGTRRHDEGLRPDLDGDRQVDVPGRRPLLAAQADPAPAPQLDVRRQVGLDPLAGRKAQARIEPADQDLDAWRAGFRQLAGGEAAHFLEQAGPRAAARRPRRWPAGPRRRRRR